MTGTTHSNTTLMFAAGCGVIMALAIPLRISGVAVQQGALALSLLCAFAAHAQNANARSCAWQALRSRTGLFAAAIFAAWAVTIVFSFDPLGSLQIGGRTALFLLGVVLIWAVVTTHPIVQPRLFKTLVVACTLTNVLAVASLSGVAHITSVLHANFNEPETPILFFKAYAASAFCLAPAVIWAGRQLGGAWKTLGYTALPLSLAIVVMTANRSALAGVMAMVLITSFALILTKHRFAGLLALVGVAVAVGIIGWVHHLRFPIMWAHVDGLFLPTWLIDLHRQVIWQFAFEKFLQSPWIGHGIDQLNRLPGAKTLVPGLGQGAYTVPSHPHNWILELLAETGLIGFLPVLAALGYVTWTTAKRFLKHADESALAQLALIGGFWASSLFNFSVWAVWWQLTFSVLFAIISTGNVARAPHNKTAANER